MYKWIDLSVLSIAIYASLVLRILYTIYSTFVGIEGPSWLENIEATSLSNDRAKIRRNTSGIFFLFLVFSYIYIYMYVYICIYFFYSGIFARSIQSVIGDWEKKNFFRGFSSCFGFGDYERIAIISLLSDHLYDREKSRDSTRLRSPRHALKLTIVHFRRVPTSGFVSFFFFFFF